MLTYVKLAGKYRPTYNTVNATEVRPQKRLLTVFDASEAQEPWQLGAGLHWTICDPQNCDLHISNASGIFWYYNA
jgi:hypothetical protein